MRYLGIFYRAALFLVGDRDCQLYFGFYCMYTFTKRAFYCISLRAVSYYFMHVLLTLVLKSHFIMDGHMNQ